MARQIPSNRLLKTSFSSSTPPEKNRDDMIFFSVYNKEIKQAGVDSFRVNWRIDDSTKRPF